MKTFIALCMKRRIEKIAMLLFAVGHLEAVSIEYEEVVSAHQGSIRVDMSIKDHDAEWYDIQLCGSSEYQPEICIDGSRTASPGAFNETVSWFLPQGSQSLWLQVRDFLGATINHKQIALPATNLGPVTIDWRPDLDGQAGFKATITVHYAPVNLTVVSQGGAVLYQAAYLFAGEKHIHIRDALQAPARLRISGAFGNRIIDLAH